MPQRFNEDQIEYAKNELRDDRRIWWCLLCGRPRAKNYCPVNARSKTRRHKVVSRVSIPFDKQVEYYLYQGAE
jgi:hypothetical protein